MDMEKKVALTSETVTLLQINSFMSITNNQFKLSVGFFIVITYIKITQNNYSMV